MELSIDELLNIAKEIITKIKSDKAEELKKEIDWIANHAPIQPHVLCNPISDFSIIKYYHNGKEEIFR